MFDPKEIAVNKIKNAYRKGLFSQSAKIIRNERYEGFNILEQSQKNYDALLERLAKRTHIPDEEKAQYGKTRLTPSETDFFRYWLREITPLFTARHGTEHIAYIQKTGYLMPVADRRRQSKLHQNSRTDGFARQEHNYFVLGIGDQHPVPISVSNSKTITLYFDRMNPVEKKQFAGMFISGHLIDYERDITYPIVVCGNTEYKVSYDKQAKLRTTTFKRVDGTIIKESLSFADEIVVANPSVDVIFEWLGYKFIEYLRFIGGEFQKDILNCRDTKKIATVFHTLFPSYRFPELKIPLSKIPMNASYVKVSSTEEVNYKEIAAFHQACYDVQLDKVVQLLKPSTVNAQNQHEHSPLFIAVENYRLTPEQLSLIKLLLTNGADANYHSTIKTILSMSLRKNEPQLLSLIMQGSSKPECPTLRILPKVEYCEMSQIIESHNLDLFNKFYPHFLEYSKSQELLSVARRSTREKELKSYNVAQKKQHEQDFEDSLIILERILADCDPNKPQYSENQFCTAAQHGQGRAIQAFLKHKLIDINQEITSNNSYISPYEGWNALHFACWKGHKNIVTDLINAGINLNKSSYLGFTPLDITEKVLSGEIDFMSAQERSSEQLQQKGLEQLIGKTDPKTLTEEEKENYRDIIKILKDKDAKNGVIEESQPKPKQKNYAVIACVVAQYKNTKYALLVRKKNTFDLPHGNYLFPGGFFDSQRDKDSFTNSGVREVLEETGVNISDANFTHLAEYETLANRTYTKRHFLLADLGTVNRLPRCIPNSDVAEALWVKAEQIQLESINNQVSMQLNKIAISYSNALILSKIFAQTLPNPQDIIDSQKIIFESKLISMASVIFYILHLDFNPDELSELCRTISVVKEQLVAASFIPEYLKLCLDGAFQAMTSNNHDKASELIQNMVSFITKVGLYHIDDLQMNKMNLFQYACLYNKTKQLRFLVEHGADVNRMTPMGLTSYPPISLCLAKNAMECAQLLLEEYQVNLSNGNSTENAVTIACQNPNISDDFIVKMIQKVEIIPDYLLGTMVHALLISKRFYLLDNLLTQYPLDLNQKYLRPQSLSTSALPIMTAINIYRIEAINILIKHGSDIAIQYSSDFSLLDFAKSLKTNLESSRKNIISHLPTHEKHEEYKKENSLIYLQSPLGECSSEELQKLLNENEKDISELDEIIALILSNQLSISSLHPSFYDNSFSMQFN